MPDSGAENLGRVTPAIIAELCALLGEEAVLHSPEALFSYRHDASVDEQRPGAVCLPRTTEEVAGLLRLAARHRLPVTPRGAGTCLSGGAVPREGGLVLSLARMNRIREVSPEDRRALVEPGVVNLHLSQYVAPSGLCFVPDPSSQKSCTIGGNVAENSGGPHCLRDGVTTNHVLGVEIVLIDGTVLELGGPCEDPPGLDLRAAVVGSEGTLGVVTAAWVRLSAVPERVRTALAIFDRMDDAARTVSALIGRGIVPAALEMMDRTVMQAVEQYVHVGYPDDAEAALLVEVDGPAEEVDALSAIVVEVCEAGGAREVRVARDAAERDALWRGRKEAFGAIGRITRHFYVQDGVIPRTHLARVLGEIARIGARYRLRIANVFHAGDGNLHPLILFDKREEGALERVKECGREILQLCVDAGGTLTGEHGIGMEKIAFMGLLFDEPDVEVMRRLKAAFDPEGLCNPRKAIPWPGLCAEGGRAGRDRRALETGT